MRIRNILLFAVSITCLSFYSSCKQDSNKNTSQEATASSTTPVELNKASTSKILPDPCATVSREDIANLLSKSVDLITHKNSNSASSTTRSCFYRWSDSKVPNAAILLQALGNPVPDEFAGWATAFIENKKSNGERLLSDPDTPIKYVTLKGLGEHTCYNLQESKCYIRIGDIVYLIATNGIEDDKTKMNIFKTLGSKILAEN